MRGAAFAVLVLLVSAAGPKPGLADTGDSGVEAVDAFFRTCLSDASAYDELAAGFHGEGWHIASDAETAKIDVILGASKEFIGKNDFDVRLDVFASGPLIAVISQSNPEQPLVGCYLYAIGVPGASAKAALLARTTIPAPENKIEEGHFESLKWGPDNGFDDHISLKFMHVVPGGAAQKQLDLNGVLLATTIFRR